MSVNSNLAFCEEIHLMAAVGDMAKINVLLKEHPDLISSKDDYGRTPLHWAAQYGHKDVAELLLAARPMSMPGTIVVNASALYCEY